MHEIDYRGFIQKYFYIKTKEGKITPFIFNDVQNMVYDDLLKDYGPTFQGIRENEVKGRQFGISTLWSGIFSTDFILSALGEIDLTDSEIYSYRDKDTKAHFSRVNMFIESYLLASQGGDYADPEHRLEVHKLRPHFFKTDTTNLLIAKNKTQIQTATAGARTAGRGSTVQNIHWTEPAFYPNTPILSAETLMTGAEEQVPDGAGKIVRESTGHMLGDYFSREYFAGKDGRSDFKSRFLVWYMHKPYTKVPVSNWVVPDYYEKLISTGVATKGQCYWHFLKTRELKDKIKLREYPTYDVEAFLMSGTGFFDELAMIYHNNHVRKPMKEAMYVQAL